MATRSSSTSTIARDDPNARAFSRNLLLSKVPDSELAPLLDGAELIQPALREILFEIGDPIDRIFFPVSAMLSLLIVMKDGTLLESITVGREGFVGIPLFNGLPNHRTKGMCQIQGEVFVVSAKLFGKAIAKAPTLRTLLHRYSQFTSDALAQSAACNGRHLMEQRCARWLLTSADAVGSIRFNLTQEFLSQMLAVRRPGVTVVMGELERRGLIRSKYGAVRIIDADGLKKVACECYRVIRDRQRELLER